MKLTDNEIDVLTELINIGVGRAASSLADLVGKQITLAVPNVTVCDLESLSDHLGSDDETLDTLMIQDFQGYLSGRAVLAFPRSSGLKLGQILGRLDSLPNELDVDLSGILTEVGNIVLNGVLGSMGNIFDTTLQYSLPELLTDCTIDDLVTIYASVNQQIGRTVIVANAQFDVAEREIDGSLVIVFELGKIESALRTILPAA